MPLAECFDRGSGRMDMSDRINGLRYLIVSEVGILIIDILTRLKAG
ncbi:hypothetical protein GCM10027355_35260 [Haloplanus salinarum]